MSMMRPATPRHQHSCWLPSSRRSQPDCAERRQHVRTTRLTAPLTGVRSGGGRPSTFVDLQRRLVGSWPPMDDMRPDKGARVTCAMHACWPTGHSYAVGAVRRCVGDAHGGSASTSAAYTGGGPAGRHHATARTIGIAQVQRARLARAVAAAVAALGRARVLGKGAWGGLMAAEGRHSTGQCCPRDHSDRLSACAAPQPMRRRCVRAAGASTKARRHVRSLLHAQGPPAAPLPAAHLRRIRVELRAQHAARDTL